MPWKYPCGNCHQGQRSPYLASTGRYVMQRDREAYLNIPSKPICCPLLLAVRHHAHTALQPWLCDNRCVCVICASACVYLFVGPGLKQPIPEVITHVDSMDLFPVSWCETNGYPLQFPCKPRGQCRKHTSTCSHNDTHSPRWFLNGRVWTSNSLLVCLVCLFWFV